MIYLVSGDKNVPIDQHVYAFGDLMRWMVGGNDLFDLGFTPEEIRKHGLSICVDNILVLKADWRDET